MITLGFTGTREGMTLRQLAAADRALRDTPIGRILHGGCRGADAEIDHCAALLGIPRHCYPGPHGMAELDRSGDLKILDARDYHARNRVIVQRSSLLLVAPKQSTYPAPRLRKAGGTWWTARYAASTGRRAVIVWPDGQIEVSTL